MPASSTCGDMIVVTTTTVSSAYTDGQIFLKINGVDFTPNTNQSEEIPEGEVTTYYETIFSATIQQPALAGENTSFTLQTGGTSNPVD